MPLPSHQRAIDLGERCWAREENFKVCLGVLDNNTIDILGIGAHLIYLTILSRNEDPYFRNSPANMDKFEPYLAIVNSSFFTFLRILVSYLFALM